MLPRLQRAASETSRSQAASAIPSDPSCVAMRFDAGSPGFRITSGNVLTGSTKTSKRIGLLDLFSQADARALDRWVVDQVHEHHFVSSQGQDFQPEPFAGRLTLKLP